MEKWSDIKSEIINTGFETSTAYEKNKSRIIEAVNRAVLDIAGFMPINKVHTVSQEASTMYDLSELIPDMLSFADKVYKAGTVDPAVWKSATLERILIEGSGDFDIYYHKKPNVVDETSADDFTFGLHPEAMNLVPLLASFYVWLDDDAQKATMYQNMYDSAKQALLQRRLERERRPRATINTSFKRYL